MKKSTILLLAYLPYYLNDFANIFVTSYPVWGGIDYAVRLGIIGFLYLMVRREALSFADLGLKPLPLTDFMVWTSGTLAVSMGYMWVSEFVVAPFYPRGSLGGVPVDSNSLFFLFDVSIGLVLVGFSEEIVCRGLTLSVLRKKFSTPFLYVISALLFSLMHWSLSAHTLVDAFVYGLIFVPSTLVTRSIWPATVVHFFVNFVLYSL